MRPAEVQKINNGSLKVDDVCLRASSLLKNIINFNWELADSQETVDKENINSQNQMLKQQQN